MSTSLSSTSPMGNFSDSSSTRRKRRKDLFRNDWMQIILVVVVAVVALTFVNSWMQAPVVNKEDLTTCGDVPLVNATKKSTTFKKMLWFYAPWCGHCTAFVPQWDRFIPMKPASLIAEKVNGDEASNRVLMEKYKIRGFPTFIFIREDGTWETYSGPRTAEGLLDFNNNA